jgi:tetratricopeptide (TPR) repeat protein
MKRTILFFIICVFTASIVQAQRGEIRRAERSLNRGELNTAKEHIDAAAADASTKDDPATWILKARVYMEIASTQEPGYKDLVEDPVAIADKAIIKAKEIGINSIQEIQIQQLLLVLSELVYNSGVEAFQADRFNDASKRFLRSYEILEPYGSVDTTTLYNAGLASELGANYEEAKKIYNRLVDMKYDQPYLFTSLANISMAQGDTVTALNYVLSGRKRYPDDLNIIFNEANIYIFTGQAEKAKDVLAIAIEKDPDNHTLYFALGANFDRMVQDTAYTMEDRQTFFIEAEKYYKLAIEKKPDYFDGVFNLGVLYFNEGIRIYDKADSDLRRTQDFRQYEKDSEKFKEAWLRSQPYFERAKELISEDDPYYQTLIISLVQLYARTGQNEELQEVQAIYHKLFSEEDED